MVIFWCNNNKLKNLKFCHKEINGDFYCVKNKIETLLSFPMKIIGLCDFSGNEKLNNIQNDKNFDVLYKEHKRLVSKELKQEIDFKIGSNNNITRKNKI